MVLISKEQFLEERNKLSPKNFKATFAMLTKFQQEKKPLLKDNDWCLDKLRIPFISWLSALPAKKEKKSKQKKEKEIFKDYPKTKF
jgi:hypothetical protein